MQATCMQASAWSSSGAPGPRCAARARAPQDEPGGAPTKAPRWGRAGTSLGGVAPGAARLSDWPSAAGGAWPRSRGGVAWPLPRALIGPRPPAGRGLGAAEGYKRRLCPRPRRTGRGRQQRRTRSRFALSRARSSRLASPRVARTRPARSSGARSSPPPPGQSLRGPARTPGCPGSGSPGPRVSASPARLPWAPRPASRGWRSASCCWARCCAPPTPAAAPRCTRNRRFAMQMSVSAPGTPGAPTPPLPPCPGLLSPPRRPPARRSRLRHLRIPPKFRRRRRRRASERPPHKGARNGSGFGRRRALGCQRAGGRAGGWVGGWEGARWGWGGRGGVGWGATAWRWWAQGQAPRGLGGTHPRSKLC